MSEIKESTMYKCPECSEPYDAYNRAAECAYDHAKETAINADFETGSFTLKSIWYRYGIHRELPKEMENITKDNCFVISYLQCCDHPAYQIWHISKDGDITVAGDGGWSGVYSSKVGYHCLTDPRPESELWKYSEQGAFGKNKLAPKTSQEAS